MKNIFLLSSRLWVFLTEIPPVFFLFLAIKHNDKVDALTKLYPLIIMLSLAVVIIFLYFFRGIKINMDEVRSFGVFSDRNFALISNNSRILITKRAKNKLKIEVFGIPNEDTVTYEWLVGEKPQEINLYRQKAYGSSKKIAKIMRFFGIADSDIDEALTSDSFTKEYKFVGIDVTASEENTEYNIRVKQIKTNE